jgi:mycoredoxin
MSQPPTVEFYWRPGCYFCTSLERSLTEQGFELDKRNIWEDPSHAAFVRSVADGNETVPTVVVGDVSMVNPSPAQVARAVRQGDSGA